MATQQTFFAAELEALVARHSKTLTDAEVITTLEEALSRAWGFACEPQPASLFEHAPKLRERLQAILDWADFALLHPNEFNSHGTHNLDGPVFDEARAVLAKLEAS